MKRKSIPTERKLARALRPHAEWRVLPTVFLATLMALPVNAAIIIPGDPLASGVRVAPNVLFILDDSGSMAWENINNGDISAVTGSGSFSDGPNSGGVTSGNTGDFTDATGNGVMYDQNYSTNTLYYNPTVTYEPWYNSTGVRLTGGTTYDDAYSDTNFVDFTGVENSTASAQLNLTGATRTFYAPKAEGGNTTYLSNIGNYYRFQLLAGTTTRVMRGQWGQVAVSTNSPTISPNSGTTSGGTVLGRTTASVATGRSMEITINNSSSGSGTRSLNYSVVAPSGTTVCSGTANEAASATCTTFPTEAGAYTINLQRSGDTASNRTFTLSARTSTSCDGNFTVNAWSWVGCEEETPVIPDGDGDTTQRSLDAEKVNFATWYSYYRTRIKTAKGGAAEAFNTQGNKVRVGYRSLWQNGSSNFDIPVTDGNDGRFVNNDGTNGNPSTTSRSKWFNRLFRASATNGTPLQSVLDGAGQYFQGNANTGPYGPETGTNQLSCRQNFTVLTTDGYWNNGTVSTGTAGDGANGSVITNGLPAADLNYKTYQYKQPAPYKDGNSNTLADVAMKYWKTDLRTDLDNNVPSEYSKIAAENDQIGKDPAFWQHMVTFTISIGLKAKSGLSSVSEVTTATTWAAPGDDDVDNIDDLLHAAVNGRGTFVSASSPQAFADGLEAALAKISERTASFSNVGATSSTNLNTGTLIFSASYVSGRWTGLLRAENALTGAEVWKTTNAGSIPSYASRNIITRGGTLTGGVGAGGTGGGATFPTVQQTAALVRTGGPANYEVSGADNASYIRGNQTKEGVAPGKLRTRSTLLGDIVDSSPTYVTDTNTVYIGANDGMLHAFNASNGQELFAYIPGIINFGNLADLSRRDYDHRWFVDGPISVSTRSLSPDGTKNILVGSLGRGGKGVYALDVTTPASFGTGNVKWERSSTSSTPASDNMGLVLGKPVLAKVRNGTSTSAVVLGNGVNSGSDKAVLVVLNMDDGSVIREIPTDNTTNNGLFAPTGIYAADGKTLVYAYAGDLQGNVWKFDLTSSTPGSWSAKKIFHAEKTAGVPQPITGGIASAVDPRTNKRWIFFGTGSFLTAADANDITANKQSVYGVMDDITTGSAYTRSNLTARSVTSDGAGERYFQDLVAMTNKGWYLDLPDNGERMVLDAQIDGSYLQFNTMMPSGNSCADAAGSGYINAITPFSDMSASTKSYFDLDGDGNTDDAGTSGKPTGSVKTNGIPTLSLLLPGEGRYGTADGVRKYNKGRPQWNRVSWRELRED
ncbi:pilus assembly protein [Thermomonas sp.]|uniref:pilus assembly protein n=1 Tax=Thermomonas sp. TaxID=1971895 RepID=UPI0035AEE00B